MAERKKARGGQRERTHAPVPPHEDGSAYRTYMEPTERPETSLEAALKVADYWRTKCIALLEENYQLKRDVLEAVADKLRLAVVVKEVEG